MTLAEHSLLVELVSERIINLTRALNHDKHITDEGRDAYREQIRVAHRCLESLNADRLEREVRRVA